MKKFIGIFSALAVLLTFTTTVNAATVNVGNDSSARSTVDTYSNFTIIDTNHAVNIDGFLQTFKYYASNSNPFRFVLVDGSNKVKWISDEITPNGTLPGAKTYTQWPPVKVKAGWNLGMYFKSTGTIPFEYTGSPAVYTPNNNGLPNVGDTLTVEGTSGRIYSLIATGNNFQFKEPEDEDHCRGNGWKGFKNPFFRDQNDCEGYVRFRHLKMTTGDITMSDPSQHIKFNAFDFGKSKFDKGNVEYWNNDYPGVLHYKTKVMCTVVSGKDARFMFQIPDGWPGLTGLYVVVGVHDGGTPGTNGDTYAHTATSDLATAKSWCETGSGFSPTSYSIVGGNLAVHK